MGRYLPIGSRATRALVLAGALGIGCSTVELGAPPADVNACRPSQMFFVAKIWPEFLGNTYPDNKTCGQSSCHDAASQRLLRVVEPASVSGAAPPPTFPLVPGSDWDIAYQSATQQMICTNSRGSELYTRPAGLRNHGGGTLIDPNGPEGILLDMWVAASP